LLAGNAAQCVVTVSHMLSAFSLGLQSMVAPFYQPVVFPIASCFDSDIPQVASFIAELQDGLPDEFLLLVAFCSWRLVLLSALILVVLLTLLAPPVRVAVLPFCLEFLPLSPRSTCLALLAFFQLEVLPYHLTWALVLLFWIQLLPMRPLLGVTRCLLILATVPLRMFWALLGRLWLSIFSA
ncbi:unnamed protein product, partial [Prorocentrum cordatum]